MLDNAQITAIVPVSNIETAIEFYEGALGLRLDERRDDSHDSRIPISRTSAALQAGGHRFDPRMLHSKSPANPDCGGG